MKLLTVATYRRLLFWCIKSVAHHGREAVAGEAWGSWSHCVHSKVSERLVVLRSVMVVTRTKSGVTWEMDLWAGLSGIIFIVIRRWEDLPSLGSTISWPDPVLCKWRKGPGQQHTFALFWLRHNRTSCFKAPTNLNFQPRWTVSCLTYDLKQTISPWVLSEYFITARGEETKTACFPLCI